MRYLHQVLTSVTMTSENLFIKKGRSALYEVAGGSVEMFPSQPRIASKTILMFGHLVKFWVGEWLKPRTFQHVMFYKIDYYN